MILDTSFLIDILRGKDEVKEIEQKLEKKGNHYATSISIMEIWTGAILSETTQKEKEKIKELLSELKQYNFGKEAALIAGNIEAELTNKGEKIDIEDVMIASIALKNKEKILTRNTKYFEKIEEIEVETY